MKWTLVPSFFIILQKFGIKLINLKDLNLVYFDTFVQWTSSFFCEEFKKMSISSIPLKYLIPWHHIRVISLICLIPKSEYMFMVEKLYNCQFCAPSFYILAKTLTVKVWFLTIYL